MGDQPQPTGTPVDPVPGQAPDTGTPTPITDKPEPTIPPGPTPITPGVETPGPEPVIPGEEKPTEEPTGEVPSTT